MCLGLLAFICYIKGRNCGVEDNNRNNNKARVSVKHNRQN